MNKFRIGDKVSCYLPERKVGRIQIIRGAELFISPNNDGCGHWVHYKQCRKIRTTSEDSYTVFKNVGNTLEVEYTPSILSISDSDYPGKFVYIIKEEIDKLIPILLQFKDYQSKEK